MPHSWNARSWLPLFAGLGLACHSGEPLAPPTTAGPVDLFLGDTTPTLMLPSGQLSRSHHLILTANTEVAIFAQGLDGALHL